MSSAATPSPLLRHYEKMCLHVGFKGSMNRQGYAWLMDDGTGGRPMPYPPLFTRHVEFVPSEQHLRNVSWWWNPKDINRTLVARGPAPAVTVQASSLIHPGLSTARRGKTHWLPGVSWFVDISHGGTPNLWSNICHWSDTMMPFFEAAHLGQVARRPVSQVIMWQVPGRDPKLRATSGSFHAGVLGAALKEQARVVGAPNAPPPTYFFDEQLNAGDTLCFDEVVAVREPNLQHRSVALQTRASFSTQGVARGFCCSEVRTAFRSTVLSHLQISPPEPRTPTVTYLSRPYGALDAKKHGKAWQQRCHVPPPTLKRLERMVRHETGYELVRVVFERMTYAYQAKVISETDVFWAAHGAGMVHLTLLPRLAAAVEMFNCGHFSYLYANLALNLRVRYFAMQRTEPYCYKPQSLLGDTRKNMTKTYAYTFGEAAPVLMQAIRYHFWQDPGEELHGHEVKCELAAKMLKLTGALPAGMPVQRWDKCQGRGGDGEDVRPGMRPGRMKARRVRRRGAKQADQRLWRAAGHGPEGDGRHGQWTRTGGFG
jgi:hypothetical protein